MRRGHGRRAGSATTSSARTRRSTPSRSGSPSCSATRTALFTPTGSMANQLGLRLHVAPRRGAGLRLARPRPARRAGRGRSVLRHLVAVLGGRRAGCSTAAEPLALMITGAGAYQVNTALVVVENTHNFGGGTVQPLDEIRGAAQGHPRTVGSRMHLDGARLWNAHVASGVPLADLRRASSTPCRSASARASARRSARCWSGRRRRWREARIWRKRFGGGMRQVGILAAAGLLRARRTTSSGWPTTTPGPAAFAEAVRRRRRRARSTPRWCETNILVLDVSGAGLDAARRWPPRPLEQGVRIYAGGPDGGPAGLAPRRLRRRHRRGHRRGVRPAALRPGLSPDGQRLTPPVTAPRSS